MGVDPYEWFDNPLDSMPIDTNDRFDMYGSSDADYAFMKAQVRSNRYAPPEKMIELEENPRPEEDVADWFDTAPASMELQDESDEIEAEKSMHHKMYEIATAKYNPFSVGGSESIHDFEGGSENHVK